MGGKINFPRFCIIKYSNSHVNCDDKRRKISSAISYKTEYSILSEKALAYRYKLEAIKSQGKRNDLTSGQLVQKLTAREKVADKSGENYKQILRYIRLTHLIPQLLDKVDEKKLAFIPAVELSYLKEKEQKWLYSNLEREEFFGVPISLARKLKGISQNGSLAEKKIEDLIVEKSKTPPKQIKVSRKIISKYFPEDITPQKRDSVIDKALDEWFKRHPEKSKTLDINHTKTVER